jgi:hypothetical protein
MMGRIFFLWLLLGSCASLRAQTPAVLLLKADSTQSANRLLMILDGNTSFNSMAIDRVFFWKFYHGGNITDQHIDNISGRLKDVNNSGNNTGASMMAYSFMEDIMGSKTLGLMASLSTHNESQLSFSRDLFDVVFKGNEMFRGKNADLGPLFMQNQAFQKVGLGIFDKRNYSGVTLSVVNGQSYQNLQVDQSQLYTTANGDSLYLTYEGEYLRSDTSRTGFGVMSGIGASLDANINLPLPNNNGYITLSFSNLGFITWMDGFERMKFDSSVTWIGEEVDNVFDLDTDTLSFDEISDTIKYSVSREQVTTGMPIKVDLRLLRNVGKSDYCEAGLMLQPNRSSIPLVYAGYTAGIGRTHHITLRAMYGGYGSFRMGWEYQVYINQTWYLRAGMNDWPGVFSRHAQGASAFVTVAKFFGRGPGEE